MAVEDSNLTVQVAALRRVFGEAGGDADWIETMPRRGYRYVGPAVATGDTAAAPPPISPPALPDKPSVAVLPFTNLSGDPEQEYFADGMVEDIIAGLSRIKWLFVIARNSSFAYKGNVVDVKRVARELGVRYLVQGSVAQGRQACPHFRPDDRSREWQPVMDRAFRASARRCVRVAGRDRSQRGQRD